MPTKLDLHNFEYISFIYEVCGFTVLRGFYDFSTYFRIIVAWADTRKLIPFSSFSEEEFQISIGDDDEYCKAYRKFSNISTNLATTLCNTSQTATLHLYL